MRKKWSTKYTGKKQLLVVDLLDEGLLGAIFSEALQYDNTQLGYCVGNNSIEYNKCTTRAESTFRLARWLLDQPEFSSLVRSSAESCKKCLTSSFDGVSIRLYGGYCPQTLYRIFNMMVSGGFDLTEVVDNLG